MAATNRMKAMMLMMPTIRAIEKNDECSGFCILSPDDGIDSESAPDVDGNEQSSHGSVAGMGKNPSCVVTL